jgi:hypothetical protein
VVGESGMEAPRAELIARAWSSAFSGVQPKGSSWGPSRPWELSSAEIANIRKMLDDFEKQKRGAK